MATSAAINQIKAVSKKLVSICCSTKNKKILRSSNIKKQLAQDKQSKISIIPNQINKEQDIKEIVKPQLIKNLRNNKKKHKPFACIKCDECFSSKKLLTSHKKDCEDYLPLKTETKPKLEDLAEPVEPEKERRAYRVQRQCKKCPQTFMTIKELRNHQKEHSSLEPIKEHTYIHDKLLDRYICQTCSAEFQDSLEAEEHLKIHEEHTFACLKCLSKFKSLRALFCHMENHLEDNKIPCPMCSYKTLKLRKLLNHLTSSHLKTNVCQKCGKVFNGRSNLRKHMLRHDETKKHACIVCKNVYFGEKALLRHQICMHKADIIDDPSLLWCDICRVEFKTLNLLKYHIEKAHTKTLSKPVEKKSLCDICGQGFKDADNLKKHKISHTEDRPFMCFQCGKAFKHKYVLTYHQRIHTGERPYSCGYCGKSFRQWTPYKVHLRGHTGEKPYVCKICNKGFTTNQGLKLHLKNCFDSRENIGVYE